MSVSLHGSATLSYLWVWCTACAAQIRTPSTIRSCQEIRPATEWSTRWKAFRANISDGRTQSFDSSRAARGHQLTCSQSQCCSALISRIVLSDTSPYLVRSETFLMATMRSVTVSCAFSTMPCTPSPILCNSLYRAFEFSHIFSARLVIDWLALARRRSFNCEWISRC